MLFKLFKKKETYAPSVTETKFDMGEGYYLSYDQMGNMLGGYHNVNISLFKDGKLIRRMTDSNGVFLEFPGVEHGAWEKDLEMPFKEVTRYVTRFSRFGEDGLAKFSWMVQPDGMYWADDDGFGAEKDVEIWLYAKFDKKGRFVCPFAEKKV